MKRFLPLVITLALGQALQAQKMRDVVCRHARQRVGHHDEK